MAHPVVYCPSLFVSLSLYQYVLESHLAASKGKWLMKNSWLRPKTAKALDSWDRNYVHTCVANRLFALDPDGTLTLSKAKYHHKYQYSQLTPELLCSFNIIPKYLEIFIT